jgi:hypothetical protein
MLNYGVLSKKPAIFKNFTGLEVAEFDALTSKIKEQYNAYEQKRLTREDRKRGIGAGHPFKLSLTDRLLMPFSVMKIQNEKTQIHQVRA